MVAVAVAMAMAMAIAPTLLELARDPVFDGASVKLDVGGVHAPAETVDYGAGVFGVGWGYINGVDDGATGGAPLV